MKRKLNPVIQKELPIMRKKAIKFVEGTIKQKWKEHRAMDIVDCLLVNWFFPYEEKRIQQAKKEVFDDIEGSLVMLDIGDGNLREYEKEKQRHLSPSKEGTSNSSSKKDCLHPTYHYDKKGDRICNICNQLVSLKRSPS